MLEQVRKYKNFILSFLSSLIAGVILIFVEKEPIYLFYVLPIIPIIYYSGVLIDKIRIINRLGIHGFHWSLESSNFSPTGCIKQSSSSLDFLGIFANKWFADGANRKDFLLFINRLRSEDGKIRFLLLDPYGETINTLDISKDSTIHNSLSEIWKIKNDKDNFKTFEVRLYDEIPKFRVVIVDKQIIGVSGYVRKRKDYHASKHGWDWPLFTLNYDESKALPASYISYFNELWERSKPL